MYACRVARHTTSRLWGYLWFCSMCDIVVQERRLCALSTWHCREPQTISLERLLNEHDLRWKKTFPRTMGLREKGFPSRRLLHGSMQQPSAPFSTFGGFPKSRYSGLIQVKLLKGRGRLETTFPDIFYLVVWNQMLGEVADSQREKVVDSLLNHCYLLR